jgi:2-polyprenyl-3-methyl-5-hydroxy-6-metoxy-1,4-benzoquinol methylase
MAAPKETSADYESLHADLLEKYRKRDSSHWRRRIQLAHDLVERYAVAPGRKAKKEVVVADMGCSIGTFALEFAKAGYRSYGVDFDPVAIQLARQLAVEEGVEPTFICGDLGDLPAELPEIDIAICFDIFEHLHDDELGSLLYVLKRHLSSDGCVVFHTHPTQYDYLIYRSIWRRLPLMLFRSARPELFNRVVKAYALLADFGATIIRGVSHEELVSRSRHCNQLTKDRLESTLTRLNYEIVFIETGNIYDYDREVQECFAKQPLAHRNLYGVARPRRGGGAGRADRLDADSFAPAEDQMPEHLHGMSGD